MYRNRPHPDVNRLRQKYGGIQSRISQSQDANNPVKKALDQISSKIDQQQRSKEEDFEKLQKLGAGSFGVVYLVRRRQDNKKYVMKIIDMKKMSTNQKRESVLEATIMSKVHCQYVCKYYDSFMSRDSINIIMEYCENGDLGKYLKKQMNRPLNE